MASADDLILQVGGHDIAGWTSIRLTRSIERFPSDFEIQMTEGWPTGFVVMPGDACKVLLGDDLVLTGYIDGYGTSIASGQHKSRIVGRSRCCDLVDASAELPNSQINEASVLDIAKALAFNFGIDVEGGPEVGQPIPTFTLMYGETSFEVIERVCRYRALLAYDLPSGNLRLSRAGFLRGSSSLMEGVNVQSASIDYRIDQRFSEYKVMTQSFDVYADIGRYDVPPGYAKDLGVRRHRVKYIVSEASDTNLNQAQMRADWEYRRRAGRSAQLRVTTDSWRDGDGYLWEPNTLVNLNLPSMKLVDKWWLVADVTYQRDRSRGTTCELLLMPSEAFEVQPPDPTPYADIRQALAGTPLDAGANK